MAFNPLKKRAQLVGGRAKGGRVRTHDAAPTLHTRDQVAQPFEVRTLDEPLLDVAQVAGLLGIPAKSVYECIYHHALPTRRCGRSLRFHKDEVEAWSRWHREAKPHLRAIRGGRG